MVVVVRMHEAEFKHELQKDVGTLPGRRSRRRSTITKPNSHVTQCNTMTEANVFRCNYCPRTFKQSGSRNAHEIKNAPCARKMLVEQQLLLRDSGFQAARNNDQDTLPDEPMDIDSDENTAEAHFQMYPEGNEPPDDAPMETLAVNVSDQNIPPSINPSNSAVEVEPFPEAAGTRLGSSKTVFEAQLTEEYDTASTPWGAFGTEAEWKLAKWLMGEGLSNGARDRYFGLPKVCI